MTSYFISKVGDRSMYSVGTHIYSCETNGSMLDTSEEKTMYSDPLHSTRKEARGQVKIKTVTAPRTGVNKTAGEVIF